MPPLRHFIFDWSGTLVDDLPPVLEATNAVMAYCGRPALTREEFLRTFELPFQRFYERILPGVDLQEMEPVFHAAFKQAKAPATPLPFARDFLAECQRRGARSFVLSAAHPDHVQSQAEAFGFAPFFEKIYAGVRDKTAVIRHILEEHQLDPASTAMIGDMTHDVETAHHGGIHAIAVLTGYQDEARLSAVRPHFIFRDLAEMAQRLSA